MFSSSFVFSSAQSARCVGFVVRSSSRSASGFVASVQFPAFASAAQFSRAWSAVLPSACRGAAVRPSPRGGFSVSVPVAASRG